MSLVDRINAIAEEQIEYETSHIDAGNNYAHMVAELWDSGREESLAEYMREKRIDWRGLEIDDIASHILGLDLFEMESSHIYGMGNGQFLLASFPVGEVEMQIDAAAMGLDFFTPTICERLSRQSDVVVKMQDSDTIFAYQTTDSVWDAVISESALRDVVKDLQADLQADLQN